MRNSEETRRIDPLLAVVMLSILLVGLVLTLVTCSRTPAESVVIQQATPTPCPECPECPVPTPCPVPFPGGELWAGTSRRPVERLGVAQACELYAIERWEPVLEPMYAFTAEPPGIHVTDALAGVTGTVRLALARPVPDVGSPPLPGDADPEEWVLLVPCIEDHCVGSWQEAISTRRSADPAAGRQGSLVIEWPVGDVIPFANDESSFEASVASLAPALLARREGDVGGLWVEALLVRQGNQPCCAPGDARWALYHFSKVAPPGDGDRRRAYCCDWLRCGQAWRPECTVRCAPVACP